MSPSAAAWSYGLFMKIRRATEADASVMRSLWNEFNEEVPYTPYPGAPFEESLLTDFVALVAEDEGGPLGCVYANTRQDKFGFVFGLYVRPACRRQGIARTLMRSIAEALDQEGKDYVVLSVDTPNVAARSLYERLGFVDAGRTLRTEVAALVGTDL